MIHWIILNLPLVILAGLWLPILGYSWAQAPKLAASRGSALSHSGVDVIAYVRQSRLMTAVNGALILVCILTLLLILPGRSAIVQTVSVVAAVAGMTLASNAVLGALDRWGPFKTGMTQWRTVHTHLKSGTSS